MLGTTPQTVVGHNLGRLFLMVQNQSDVNTVWMRFHNQDDLIDMASASLPSFRIAPGGVFVLEGEFIPSGRVSMVATGANTPVLIWEG